MSKIENVKKIAVLRANNLGDFIFSLPAFNALKATYPEAELVLLGLPWHKAFLTGRPMPIDRVEVVPIYRGVRREQGKHEDPAELDAFFRRMRAEEFDLAIQLHGGGRHSNPFVSSLGARVTAGYQTSDAISLDITLPYLYYQNEYFRYLELVSLLGVATHEIEPSLEVMSSDIEEARAVLSPVPSPLVILHPGARDVRRQWSATRFAQVGDALAAQGITVAVTGIEEERRTVERVINNMRHDAVDLCGQLSLQGFTGLLYLADLVISNDSGPLHLASAVGTPTVGIYWVGNMINGARLTRGRHYPAVSFTIHCSDCGTDISSDGLQFQHETSHARGASLDANGEPDPHCAHECSFVDSVPLEEVLHYAAGFLRRMQQGEVVEQRR